MAIDFEIAKETIGAGGATVYIRVFDSLDPSKDLKPEKAFSCNDSETFRACLEKYIASIEAEQAALVAARTMAQDIIQLVKDDKATV